jgi:hypothetical protein
MTKPKPTDKAGEKLDEGDTVELVYGGDYHIGKITDITEELGTELIHVAVIAKAPPGRVLKVDPKTPTTGGLSSPKQPDNSRRRSAD